MNLEHKYDVINHLTDEQTDTLVELYQAEWWTKGRRLADVRRMLANSDLIIAYCERENRRLVAFARVLTDYVYKALIFDVIVASAARKQGLGRALLDEIIQHSALSQVHHLELYCAPEMKAFYEQWGFTAELGVLTFMRRN